MLRKTKRFLALAVSLIMLFGAQTAFAAEAPGNGLDAVIAAAQEVVASSTPATVEQLQSLVYTTQCFIGEGQYTTTSRRRVTDALGASIRVLNLSSPHPTIVNHAYTTLTAAVIALVPVLPVETPSPLVAVTNAVRAVTAIRGNGIDQLPAIREAQRLIDKAFEIVRAAGATNFLVDLNNAQVMLNNVRRQVASTVIGSADIAIYIFSEDTSSLTNMNIASDWLKILGEIIADLNKEGVDTLFLTQELNRLTNLFNTYVREYNWHQALAAVVAAEQATWDADIPGNTLARIHRAQEFIVVAEGLIKHVADPNDKASLEGRLSETRRALGAIRMDYLKGLVQHEINRAQTFLAEVGPNSPRSLWDRVRQQIALAQREIDKFEDPMLKEELQSSLDGVVKDFNNERIEACTAELNSAISALQIWVNSIGHDVSLNTLINIQREIGRVQTLIGRLPSSISFEWGLLDQRQIDEYIDQLARISGQVQPFGQTAQARESINIAIIRNNQLHDAVVDGIDWFDLANFHLRIQLVGLIDDAQAAINAMDSSNPNRSFFNARLGELRISVIEIGLSRNIPTL